MGSRGLFSKRHMLIVLIGLFLFASLAYANDAGQYNQTPITQVNVTSAAPIIRSITIPSPINLNPGTTKEINCTVKVTEYNGWETIKHVNATLWDNNNVSMNDSDMNTTHYTNDNCTRSTTDEGPFNRTYHCTFDIQYYAYNSTQWICNATVLDNSSFNFTDTEYNTTTINPLYAINVTPIIDFGEATLGELITNRTANLTNFGNQAINISVQGYGQNIGDGLAMFCPMQGNITIDNLKFSSDGSPSKTAMTGAIQNMSNITISKIDQTIIMPGIWQSTFWDLTVSPVNNPFGLCTGTVIFTAWNS